MLTQVENAIDALPPRLQATARRRFIDEADYGEIADELQIRQANARKRVQGARQFLRPCLRIYLYEEGE